MSSLTKTNNRPDSSKGYTKHKHKNICDLEIIKIRHTAIEMQIEDTNNSCPSAIPKTQNTEWSRGKSYLDNELTTYITSCPETISEEVIDVYTSK